MRPRRFLLAASLASLAPAVLAPAAVAGPPVARLTSGTVADVAAAIEDGIVNAGLVIEGHHHVGDMLARTKDTVGGTKDIYTAAEMFTFCSASVSRRVMERDPANLQYCPYSIYIYETPDAPGQIVVGHRDYAAEGLPEVSAMLDKIVASALD